MIEVVDRDVNNIALEFRPPLEIKGQVISQVPGLDRSGLIAGLWFEGCYEHMAHVSSDGSFAFPTVEPDIHEFEIGYHLGVPAGTYLKSIQVDGREIRSSTIDLTKSTPQLTAIYASDVASLQGIVKDSQGRPTRAVVYCFYEGKVPSYWRAPLPVRSDNDGHFLIPGVIPGNYRVFAFPSPVNPMVSDPEYRSQFTDQSVVIHVEPGIEKAIDLRAISKN
jgi:hypothetical protein